MKKFVFYIVLMIISAFWLTFRFCVYDHMMSSALFPKLHLSSVISLLTVAACIVFAFSTWHAYKEAGR